MEERAGKTGVGAVEPAGANPYRTVRAADSATTEARSASEAAAGGVGAPRDPECGPRGEGEGSSEEEAMA